MKRAGKVAICLMGGLALIVGLHADNAVPPGNPYAAIVERNVFGLVPPPSPVAPSVADANPPPKLTPNGIMTIFGIKQVLFKATTPARQDKPAKDDYYTLAEGQRQDDIEVVKIDEKAGLITFDNHGEIQELPLTDTPATSTAVVSVNPYSGNRFDNGGNRFAGRFNSRGVNNGNPGARNLDGSHGGGNFNGGNFGNGNFNGDGANDNVANGNGNFNGGANNGSQRQAIFLRGGFTPPMSPEAQAILNEARSQGYTK